MQIRAASDFGAVVADRRRALGLTQAELAHRVGASREWIGRLENDSSSVTLYRLMRVLREVGIRVDVADDE